MPTYQAKSGNKVFIDSTEGWTINLPINPSNNDKISVHNLAPRDATIISITKDGIPLKNIRLPGYLCSAELVYSSIMNAWYADNFVAPRPGLLSVQGGSWNPGTIDATYKAVQFTGATVSDGLLAWTAPSQFSIAVPGVYNFQFVAAIEHDEAQAGRTTNVRLANVTQGTFGDPVAIGTGRNQGVTNISIPFLIDLESPGDVYQLEMGGGE